MQHGIQKSRAILLFPFPLLSHGHNPGTTQHPPDARTTAHGDETHPVADCALPAPTHNLLALLALDLAVLSKS